MIGLVWAQGHDAAIGKDGTLAWHLPEDMALFKALTLGHTVAMGRKTWESLPERFRPLPERKNIVISRKPELLELPAAVNATKLEDFLHTHLSPEAHTALEAPRLGRDPHDRLNHELHLPQDTTFHSFEAVTWVIGGAEIYRALLPYAHLLAVTDIDTFVENADAFAPRIGFDWRVLYSYPQRGWLRSTSAHMNYRFTLYFRPKIAQPNQGPPLASRNFHAEKGI